MLRSAIGLVNWLVFDIASEWVPSVGRSGVVGRTQVFLRTQRTSHKSEDKYRHIFATSL